MWGGNTGKLYSSMTLVFAVFLHPAPGWTMSCHCSCITITLSIQKHEKNIVGSYHCLLFYKYGNKLVFGIWHSPTPTAWWTWQHLCDLPGPSCGVLWEPTPHGKRREELHVWRSCGAVSQLLITHLLCLPLGDSVLPLQPCHGCWFSPLLWLSFFHNFMASVSVSLPTVSKATSDAAVESLENKYLGYYWQPWSTAQTSPARTTLVPPAASCLSLVLTVLTCVITSHRVLAWLCKWLSALISLVA